MTKFACSALLLLVAPAAAQDTSAAHWLQAAGTPVTAPDGFSDAELLTLGADLAPRLLALGVDDSLLVEGWPTAPGERSAVELTRLEVYAPDARIVKVEKGKLVDLPRSRLAFFRGLVAEDPEARVMLAVDPDTLRLEGMTSRPDAVHELRPWGKSAAGDRYLLASTDSFKAEAGETPSWSCGQQNTFLDGPFAHAKARRLTGKAGISSLHTATIAVDTDNELLHLKFGNNTTNATNYIAALIAAMNVMYERDLLVRLLQGFTVLRPSPGGDPTNYTTDPYSQSCIFLVNGSPVCAANGSQLNELTSYWSGGCAGTCSGVSRALTMMLSGKQTSNNSASGIAWLNVLCSTGSGYSFSQVFKFNGSTAAHDSRLVGHELGHNFGSPHTHCYSPAVDNCYNLEGGCYSGSTSCPAAATYNGVGNVRGTVMSYCHNLGGCGSSEVFHPATVNLLDDIILSKTTGGNACILPLAPAGPTVSSVSPNNGLTNANTAVTIAGTGFQSGAAVTFDTGGGAVAGGGVVVVNANTITALAPPHATGAVRVTVTNPSTQSGFRDNAFFYAPPPAAAGFFTLTPCRVLDTRNANGPLGGPALAANATRTFTVAGVCGIPANASAISANVTVVAGGAAGGFSIYPGNAFPLGTSTLNFPAGGTRASATLIRLATDGTGTIGVQNSSGGANHILIDVNGYFQ